MRARRWASALVLTLFLTGTTMPAASSPSGPSDDVSAVVGTGVFGRILCVGCAAGIVAAGGMTIAGSLFVAGVLAEGAVACVDVCVRSF